MPQSILERPAASWQLPRRGCHIPPSIDGRNLRRNAASAVWTLTFRGFCRKKLTGGIPPRGPA
jgi:hypothetical protein